MERTKLKEDAAAKEASLPKWAQKPNRFFSSGSTLFDLMLGQGWALSRIFNIVGDKSTGKTLVGIEAFANFERAFKDCRMKYAEAEAAFDPAYAKNLGFPDNVEKPDRLIRTVEEFRDDVQKFIGECKNAEAGLYILDSLDALSDADEMDRFNKGKLDEGSYGTGKAKGMSEFFRVMVQDIAASNCSLGIISQIRDNIGVTFGNHYTRSGGHALDFYATHVIWLAHLKMMERTVKSDDRAYGIEVLAKCKKNKVSAPFREVELQVIFGYGMDDELSMINWLRARKEYSKETAEDFTTRVKKAREAKDFVVLKELSGILRKDTIAVWGEIEKELEPPVKKYEQ